MKKLIVLLSLMASHSFASSFSCTGPEGLAASISANGNSAEIELNYKGKSYIVENGVYSAGSKVKYYGSIDDSMVTYVEVVLDSFDPNVATTGATIMISEDFDDINKRLNCVKN